MAVVSDSSPLIAFAAIEQLDLLPAIFQTILIPPSVAAEIAPSIPALPPWLCIRGLSQPITRKPCAMSQNGQNGLRSPGIT